MTDFIVKRLPCNLNSHAVLALVDKFLRRAVGSIWALLLNPQIQEIAPKFLGGFKPLAM
jgi:hypothetical protein